MRRVAVAGVGSVGLALSAAACQAIAGIHEYGVNDPQDASAVSITTVGAGADGSPGAPKDTCNHAALPSANGGVTGDGLLYFALDSLAFGSPVDASALGFDLDGICTDFNGPTYDDGASSCVPPTQTAAFVTVPTIVDGPGGVDNALQKIFNTAQTVLPPNTIPTNQHIQDGAQTLLLRVSGWAGATNVASLDVDVLISEQLEVTTDCDAGTYRLADAALDGADGSDAGSAVAVALPVPAKDGCDIWSVSAESVQEIGTAMPLSKFRSSVAYVANNVLVATFPHLPLPVGATYLDILDGHIVASIELVTLASGEQIYKLTNGTMSGRVTAPNLLNSFKALSVDMSGDGGLCPGNMTYDFALKPTLCNSVDINQSPEAGLLSGCDSISFAVAMSAVQTRKEGDVLQNSGLHIQSNCDAALDTCPNIP